MAARVRTRRLRSAARTPALPMALFLSSGDTRTLPVMMWMSMRSAATPVLAVAAIILLSAVVVGLGTIAWLLKRRQGRASFCI
jgi:ABC-type spermidine/putrescine transport system permease subunit II